MACILMGYQDTQLCVIWLLTPRFIQLDRAVLVLVLD